MTQTMSGPNDWLQFYNQNLTPSIPDFTVAAATTTTTTTTTATSHLPNTSPSASTQLGPEGRVGKPTRRRSRASRRTPTTLLNTDTTNFRAMVQQFTGGPNAPFAPSPSAAPQALPNLLGFGFPSLSPTPLVMSSSAPLSYQQLQQRGQQHMFQQQNQHYNILYSEGEDPNNNNNNMFFQRLSRNPMSPPTSNVAVSNNNNRDGVVNLDQGRFFPNTSS